LVIENKLSRSFDWHNATQFFGALNDNVFRWLLVFFLINMLGDDRAAAVSSRTGAVFVIPFLLFTPLAGIVADRFSKRNIIVIAKSAELVLMGLGLLAFYSGLQWAVYTVLFLMCTQSAFFGPCKYGIIPELVGKDQISRANSFMEGMTYLAIVIGTAFAPWLADTLNLNFTLAATVCVVLAVVGLLASFRIEKTRPMSAGETLAEQFSIAEFSRVIKAIKSDKYLLMTVLASAYFMLLGGFAQINMIPFGMEVCGYTFIKSGYLFLIAAIGIGIGSYLAGKLSGRSVEFGIVPMGAVGMAAAAIGLGIVGLGEQVGNGGMTAIFVLISLFGVSCGLFIVPIHSFIQMRAPESIRGKIVAASGFLGWMGVLAASGMIGLFCDKLGVASSTMFLALGILTLILAVTTVIILPDFLVRLILVLLTRTIYRIRISGEENVPAEGPALIISNHVSWADAVVLMATQQRRIRFVMDREISQNRWIGWMFRLGQIIPISATDPPKKIVAALREARTAMDDGYLVCIFAEGTLTRTGLLNKFRGGFERIVKGTDYPIIPTYIGGLWGSILSHYHGKLLGALPRKLPYPVGVHFGEPMAADSSSQRIREAIEILSVDFYNTKKAKRLSLGETFIKSARKHWAKPCLSDTTGKRLSFGKALIASVALADKLNVRTVGQQNIGIFLPSTVGGALVNLSTALLNKTAVNLSYTASVETRNYMIETARIRTVLTSRKFLEKLNLDRKTLPGTIFIEDIVNSMTPAQKRRALLKALFMPRAKLAHRGRNFSADDTAIILFSSGSSGRSKGIELSHHNILSNTEGALSIFRVYKDDRLCGVLPLFHAFGLSLTLWLPIVAGVAVSFTPNPLDGKVVGRMCGKDKCTLLFATPTFLQNYLRRCKPEDFAAMRFIVTGAEKLRGELVDVFEEKFGLRPYEGYGATECSPLIALNVPDRQAGVPHQVGSKTCTVGHSIPGMAVRVLDIQTGEAVKTGEQGLLFVKGPNVMTGYLNLPEKTTEVLEGGWYNTGDIVSVDADGFVTIRDRLSRFSKIGGEMVPHGTVEEVAIKGLNTVEPVVAVTSIPDAKKGEQLVVLYDKRAVDGDKLYSILAESDLPKLYIPKRDNLIAVNEIPHLGSGKLDIMKLRQLAMEAKNNKETTDFTD